MGIEESSESLCRKAGRGDRSAFEKLAGGSSQRLRSFIERRMSAHLKSRVEVEDVLQETLAKALASVDRFEWQGEDSFSRWLTGIAANLILHLSRKHLRLEKLSVGLEVPGSEPSPSRSLRRAERFERLEQALKVLSPDHRQVILLTRIQGLPVSEVARRMDRSPKAVHQLLWRALESLRTAFGETESFRLPEESLEGGEEPDGR